MNEEIDEAEFYHQDFTTASEWEVFVARLEEILHNWKLAESKGESNCTQAGIWSIKSERIPFADVEFKFTCYKTRPETRDQNGIPQGALEVDADVVLHPLDNSFDFAFQIKANHHEDVNIYYWYGLEEFIVLSPTENASLVSESRIKMLLSSANIAIANTNCEVPIFVQVRENWQKLYIGVHEQENIRTNFEMVHLRRGPQHCQYLTGLLDLFKTKILSPTQLKPIMVSVQFTYMVNDFGSYVWKQESVDSDVEQFDSLAITLLPFGVTVDPVEHLLVKAQWFQLPDNVIVDSETYTNFDPMTASKWTLSAQFAEKPICLLSDCITEFLHLMKNQATVHEVLGDFATAPSHAEANPLDLLTESKVPTISSVLKRAARTSLTRSARKGIAPLHEEILVPMLYFLFPDAEEHSPHMYFVNKADGSEEDPAVIEEKYKGFKTCKRDSLVWRLSVILSHALCSLGGPRAVSHIWFEFVQEMRYRWERSIMIPGLAPGFPDARTCLLHQKLQMLNCCIERKKNRESSVIDKEFQSFDEGNSSDEEFFDCSMNEQQEEQKPRQKYHLWNQPVGRLGKLANLKLLQTGDQLYIPITQEPVPKTEDQLEEDTDILMKLGSDAQGSELRARMMSASLLSDMESFKAANPNSILEDFIRWYSPRDWIEEDAAEVDEWQQKKGHLSARMQIGNNTWVETWHSAKPVPAYRQRRLFDDTREAEKVLHFLDSCALSQIAELLLPVLAHAALCRAVNECEQIQAPIHSSAGTLQNLSKTIERLSRDGKANVRRYELLVQELIPLELVLAQARSLLYKLNPEGTPIEDVRAIVGELINGNQVEIVDKDQSKTGMRLLNMLSEAQRIANMLIADLSQESPATSPFPQAFEREFVMRVPAHRPAIYSTKSIQFLRAILSKNDFRLVAAFSEDFQFF